MEQHPTSENEICWQAYEYSHYEKSPDWYWVLGVAAVALIGLAVYLDNFLFAIVLTIGTFAIVLFSVRKPEFLEYAITKRGIRIGDRLFPYQTLDHFWVYEREGSEEKMLLFASNKPITPLISIPYPGDISAEKIREYLLQHVEEKEIHLPISYALMQMFRF